MAIDKKSVSRIGWACFPFKGKGWWRNIRNVPRYIKRVFFTLKHGYPPQARWETYAWFIDTMKEILEWYYTSRSSSMTIHTDYSPEENEKAVDEIYLKMIELLMKMNPDAEIYRDVGRKEADEQACNATDEFMSMFKKYFYNLWD